MHEVLISLAANCDHKKNLCEARRRLAQVLCSSCYTPEIWTDPVGGATGKYLNQLVKGNTDLDSDTLQVTLKQMEHDMGRTPADRRQGIVRIDLDLLEYNGCRYHQRDWDRPYVSNLLQYL